MNENENEPKRKKTKTLYSYFSSNVTTSANICINEQFQWHNSTAQHTYILHRYNISQWYPTKDYPEITSSVNQDNRTTSTTLSYKEDQKNDSVTGIKNMRADIVLPTVNLTNSSSIVFPNSTDEKTKINTFIPENTVIEKCSLNETFCIKVENYPREDLYKIFRTSKFASTSYHYVDAKDEVNDFETRILSDVGLQSFCQSRTEVIYPEAGLTSKNEWRYIVQAPAINGSEIFIKQGILVEKCIFPSCCQCMYSINEDMLTRRGGD
ncbi:uncharacterized protein LOC132932721 isoform X2 [Metopolophium dirhodum]|uniref:uncharacterized protein LOC132932721 isoform X2 n=1 Tax=Metopolophium dirhodum TaxID=44670 RepID=UPI00298F5DE9|nr:uncharacterized protein LOC132932721 isoform X2 [Metopolophium dirhodum]